ncbi:MULTISPECIES: carboxymuconolactone decarboxylase family protein [unclassified Pseudomonas]|uniref:carboxymuconolactone decarboxylase family protein n=1 Tax=unclassified Pseudomonas TaxID=196821 RepID=UPI000A1FDC8C|nr:MULTISPECIES: carboxymuconolactone decarboxylase family protein [unclassified Pseudomonas]
MSRIAPLSLETATDATRPTLEGVQKKIGFLPNLFTTLATAPVALDAYVQISATLGKTSLSAKEKEAVYLATSQVNGCDYCLAAHTLFASKAGLAAEEIIEARHGRLNAFATLAHQLTETRGHLSDEQIAAARAAGIDDKKIIEVIAVVAAQTLTNYLNNVALTDIDFPAIENPA